MPAAPFNAPASKTVARRSQNVILTLFLAYNGIFLFFAWTTSRTLPQSIRDLDDLLSSIDLRTAAALMLPIASLVYFWATHAFDRRYNISGLSSRASNVSEDERNKEYADTAILRQSIHALLAVALIAALIPDSEKRPPKEAFVAVLAGGALGVSTVLSLVSVLCYQYTKRWKTGAAVSAPLLRSGFKMDVWSWYSLVIGLVWLPAIKYPTASILANILFGACSFYYYFDRRQE